MPEITVLAFADAKESCADILEKAFREAVPPTHLEKGCLKYALQRSRNNKNQFVMIEKWTSQEALDLHLKTPHIQELFKKLPALLEKPMQIQVFSAVPEGLSEKLL